MPAPGPTPSTCWAFTHYWAKSRKGYWVVKQKTAADRFRRALRRSAWTVIWTRIVMALGFGLVIIEH